MRSEKIALILEEGEGYKIEFKESPSSIDKEMVAFANSSGGRIFLGINDDNTIKGVNISNKLKSQVQDTARNCSPSIEIQGYIEKMGTGINRMRRSIKEAGLTLDFQCDTFFKAVFWRPETTLQPSGEEKFGTNFGIKGRRQDRIKEMLLTFFEKHSFSVDDFARKAKVSSRAVEADLSFLRKQGLILFRGPRKTGSYVLTEKGREMVES
ncbi:MAG: RNA-binding domain-containing protein [Vulcanimicrobiota bacterium]